MICYVDKRGDLGKSTQVCKLLSYYGYNIEPIATGKLRQNDLIEVENHEIGHHP